MTLFDYIVIAVLLASLVLGFWRGMVGEVLTLAAWILAFILAKRFGDQAGQWVLGSVTDPTLRNIGGWVIAFIAVLIVMALLRWLLRNVLQAVGLGMIDRFFGVLFGVIRGALVVILLVAIGGMTPLPQKDWWKQALLSPYLEQAVRVAAPWLPVDIQSRIHFD